MFASVCKMHFMYVPAYLPTYLPAYLYLFIWPPMNLSTSIILDTCVKYMGKPELSTDRESSAMLPNILINKSKVDKLYTYQCFINDYTEIYISVLIESVRNLEYSK